MPDDRIVYRGGNGEYIEKKSRFIAAVIPISSEQEAIDFIERTKKQYWDASHNCSAYTLGEHHELTHCSDDGEPSSTAGRPMLDVLLNENIHNVCVVVTRYFGGTLLGTGGLVRAYQAAVKEGLSASELAIRRTGFPITIRTDYNFVGKLRHLAEQHSLTVTGTQYTENVEFSVLATEENVTAFCDDVTELTAGRAIIIKNDPVLFCDTSDGPVYLSRR